MKLRVAASLANRSDWIILLSGGERSLYSAPTVKEIMNAQFRLPIFGF